MDRTVTLSKHEMVVGKADYEDMVKELKELRKLKKLVRPNLLTDNLRSKLTKVKRRRVTITDIEECLICQDRFVFSLVGPAGEINSYMLTFEQALDMVHPAIDEDGYSGKELEIRIIK